ncbi:EAL domain-containing protein [Bacillus suaedae]|uniref:EAL domain-containing protein n=1 Tax=Halalkalibacter suaedae TaxID=2822140 RepID=A0A941ARZ5_9BACI|nr:EAL domain-containing protein [Bacillus suaedae]MBP3953593.1 EAL domain-containing protein [Bacillus suaedae]
MDVKVETNDESVLQKQQSKQHSPIRESLNVNILDALPINIFLEDQDGRTVFANKVTCESNGLTLDEVVGKTVFDIFPNKIAKKVREHDLEVWKSNKLITKEEITGFKGETCYMYTGKTIVQFGDESLLLGFALDITARVKAEEKIEHMAYHDALTGLPNRWYIHSYVETFIQKHPNKKMALLLLDLDHFKVINDSLGHQAGDQLLQEVSKRLSKVIDKSECLARIGGDEFIIFLPDVNSYHDCYLLCEKVNSVMSEPFLIGQRKFTVTTSIGISVFPADGEDIHTLIKHADIALYRSKASGRNGFQFYNPTMKTYANERLDKEILLRQALERDEFVLHYQPKLNLDTNQIYGFEALIRWDQKDKGIIGPGAFLQVAEETGLIVPIGEWVIRQACLRCKAWHDAGYSHLTVSVNLSASQFHKHNLEKIIVDALTESGLPSNALELELTESTVMHHPEEAVRTLQQLKKLGISISIDDFGTGFSSLSYLTQFPIDTLKIDQSFIKDVEENQANAAIASAVISLSHSLGLNVVAEGVEKEEEMQFLRFRNCHFVQGYHIAKPMQEEEVFVFLKQLM